MIVIKIILRVLLALLIIIAAALAVPTRVYIRYTNEVFLQIRYLFLKITIPITDEQKAQKENNTPPLIKKIKGIIKKKEKPGGAKEKTSGDTDKGKTVKQDKKTFAAKKEKAGSKKRAPKEKKAKKKKKPNPIIKWIKGLYKKGGVDAIIEAFKKIASLVGTVLKPIFKNIRLKQLNIDITVASDNAADTAINYGKLCAGVYPALTVILSVMKYDDYSVAIRPDFNKKDLEPDISAEISLIPWIAIGGAVHALFRFINFKVKGEL